MICPAGQIMRICVAISFSTHSCGYFSHAGFLIYSEKSLPAVKQKVGLGGIRTCCAVLHSLGDLVLNLFGHGSMVLIVLIGTYLNIFDNNLIMKLKLKNYRLSIFCSIYCILYIACSGADINYIIYSFYIY